MKKTCLLLALLLLTASAALAARHKTEGEPDAGFFAGLGPTLGIPAANFNGAYSAGFGGMGYLGYAFDGDFSALLELQDVAYSNGAVSYSDNDLRILPTLRYLLPGDKVRLYFSIGMGPVFQSASANGVSNSDTNFDLALGEGLSFDLGGKTRFFIESKYNAILTSSTAGGDIPLTAGLEFGL
jgi:opacity protein-like surface antigen